MSTEIAPTLINTEKVARMLDISERTLWRLRSAGKVPRPVCIGRSKLRRLSELRE